MEIKCSRCQTVKPTSEFWAIYSGKKVKRDPSTNTLSMITVRGNYQRYCKSCVLEWQSDNDSKYRGYQNKYRSTKKIKVELEEGI